MLHYSDITIAQVVTAYELAGLNEFSLAEQLDLSENDVKTILHGNSPLYQERHGYKALTTLDVANIAAGPKDAPAYLRLRAAYEQLAHTSDNDAVREKALKWLMEEEIGRNDIPLQHLELKKNMAQKSQTQEERLKKFNAMMDKAVRPQVEEVDSVKKIEQLQVITI